MKKIILLINLIVGSFFFTQSASALSCMQSTLTEDINKASSIFVGKVLSVDSEKASFEISRYWKGGLSQNQTINGTTYWTGYPGGNIFYNVGAEYIVYTNKDVNNFERSSLDCGRTQKYTYDGEAQVTNILGTPKYFNITPYTPPNPPTQSYCAYTNINSNLWYKNIYNNKNEVFTLQNFLFNYYDVLDEISPSGFFGKLTKSYVTTFQREMNINPTGGVGPITRQKMKETCVQDTNVGDTANCKIYFDGCNTCSRTYSGGPQTCTMMACIQGGDAAWFAAVRPVCREYFPVNKNEAPVIKSFTGPVKLNVNEKGTWKIEASIFNNQSLSYNITWGDEVAYGAPNEVTPNFLKQQFVQATTFEHTYNRAGTFTVTITVTAQNGQTKKTTSTVAVVNNTYTYCYNKGKTYAEGQTTSCLFNPDGSQTCIADASFVCRSGTWKTEGGLPGPRY